MDYSGLLNFKRKQIATTFVSYGATKQFINNKVNADYRSRGYGRVMDSFLNPVISLYRNNNLNPYTGPVSGGNPFSIPTLPPVGGGSPFSPPAQKKGGGSPFSK